MKCKSEVFGPGMILFVEIYVYFSLLGIETLPSAFVSSFSGYNSTVISFGSCGLYVK